MLSLKYIHYIVFLRYGNCSEHACRTLALTDWEKINYDLVEHVVSFVARGGNENFRCPQDGSILIFLPGKLLSAKDKTKQDIKSLVLGELFVPK